MLIPYLLVLGAALTSTPCTEDVPVEPISGSKCMYLGVLGARNQIFLALNETLIPESLSLFTILTGRS